MHFAARCFLVFMVVTLSACAPHAAAQPNGRAAHRQEGPSDHGIPAGLQLASDRIGPGEVRPGTMTVEGVERNYLIYIPTTYDSQRPAAVVLMFHGGEMNANESLLFGLNSEAERDGSLVVYPNGMPRDGREGHNWWSLSPTDTNDLAFVTALLDRVQADFSVDPARIYATGVSNGGFLGYRVACDLADHVVAVGIVASAPQLDCRPQRPVSVLHIHGTDDQLVPYNRVPRTMRTWRQNDGCLTPPTTTTYAPGVTRESSIDCREGSEVTLYTIQGGTHTWPGIAPGLSPSPISATPLIWEFFRNHTR